MDFLDVKLGLSGPETVKELQKGWIGNSSGHTLEFEVQSPTALRGHKIKCFTTKIETLPAVKFIALSSSHEFLERARPFMSKEEIEGLENLMRSIATTKESLLREGKNVNCVKIGSCTNFATGEEVPLYVADYVLEDYGTGAIMGVPCGDERDQRLAEKEGIAWTSSDVETFSAMLKHNWLDLLISQGKVSENPYCFSLRDWLVSRQRYWGTPIPIINCKTCGQVPVPESELPVFLPHIKIQTGLQSQKFKYKVQESDLKCRCPLCGSQDAQREADTLDTFVDSSWYFLRFLDPNNQEKLISKHKAEQMPVKAYIGGMEHAIKHLLYARFVHKFLFDLGLVSCSEPFENIITQGLVKGESYRIKESGQYISKKDASSFRPEDLIVEVEKMSKSKLNGISPLEAIDNFGVDCLKLAVVFAGPIEKDITLNDNLLNSMVVSSSLGFLLG